MNPRGGELDGHPIVSDPAAAANSDWQCSLRRRLPPRLSSLVAGSREFRSQWWLLADSVKRVIELSSASYSRWHGDQGVRLLGPNTMGPVVPATGLALGLTIDTPSGEVTFVSQSGGIPQMVGRRLKLLGAGFDAVVPLGNKIDIGFADALRVLRRRPGTKSVMLYMEGGGEGDDFFEALADTAAQLPVVALIGGRSEAGARAIQSHTGSMLSRRDRLAGMVEDCGAYVADSILEACAVATAGRRSLRRPTAGTSSVRVLVVSDGGGAGILASDALSEAGFALPTPSSALARECGPETGSLLTNPHDLAGAADANLGVIATILRAALRRDEFDAFVVAAEFGYYHAFGRVWEESESLAFHGLIHSPSRLVPLVIWTPLASHPSLASIGRLRDAGIPCVEWPAEAVVTLSARLYGRQHGETAGSPSTRDAPRAWDPDIIESTEETLRAFHKHQVPEALGRVVSRRDLESYTAGWWVLRLDGFAHKTSVGAIKVGVPAHGLTAAYDELAALARQRDVTEAIRLGPLVQHDHELIVTFWRDPSNGSGWAVGAGGIVTEEHNDLAVGRPPRNVDDVLRLLHQTRAGQRLLTNMSSARATADVILRIADAFDRSLPSATELECNPLAVGTEGIYVSDALLTRQ